MSLPFEGWALGVLGAEGWVSLSLRPLTQYNNTTYMTSKVEIDYSEIIIVVA